MQVEIKEITAGESKHGKFKAVEFINSIEGKTKYFVGSDFEPYKHINEGYVGMAEIETAKSKKGTIYISKFNEIEGNPTQTAQKANTAKPAYTNGAFKKDPEGIKLDIWKQKGINWISCLKSTMSVIEPSTILVDAEKTIEITNKFYDALCEKVDKKGVDTSNDINKDTIEKGANKPNIKPHPQAEAMANAVNQNETSVSDGQDIVDTPF